MIIIARGFDEALGIIKCLAVFHPILEAHVD